MKKKYFALFLALLTVLTPLVSCKKDNGKGNDTTQETIDLDYNDGYDYGKLDCGNEDFTFLQCYDDTYGMKTALTPENGETGDEFSDAVYSRNVKLGTLYNVNFKCITRDIEETADFVRTQCMGGDEAVDAAFVMGMKISGLIGEGLLNDIAAMPDIQIYEPWWGQTIREESQFGGASTLYFAQSDISVTGFELTWGVVFNIAHITALDMENPYDLVENKQWTMNKLFEMAKDGMQPNPDDSYTYNEDTSCILGLVTYNNFAMAALNGAGCFLTRKNDIGMPVFTGEGERFSDVVERYATAFNTPGMMKHANDEGFHYEDIFAKQRALFAGVEVKATAKFRATGIEYGLVPVPMYDSNQETYYSNVNRATPLLVIPNTNTNADKTGRILDTMAYLSYKELLPVYYESCLSYKQLGTLQASKMLDIIRDTRCFETSLVYGWTTDYYLEIRSIMTGYSATTTATSAIRQYKEAITTTLTAFIASLK